MTIFGIQFIGSVSVEAPPRLSNKTNFNNDQPIIQTEAIIPIDFGTNQTWTILGAHRVRELVNLFLPRFHSSLLRRRFQI
jgi:hypothetical protein